MLPLSESAVDEGSQAAGEANQDVVLVESQDVDGKCHIHIYKSGPFDLTDHLTMDIRGLTQFLCQNFRHHHREQDGSGVRI